MQEADFTRILQLEEEYIEKICSDIIALKPDVVFTEKGISDLAQHFLLKVSTTLVKSCIYYVLSCFQTICIISG